MPPVTSRIPIRGWTTKNKRGGICLMWLIKFQPGSGLQSVQLQMLPSLAQDSNSSYKNTNLQSEPQKWKDSCFVLVVEPLLSHVTFLSWHFPSAKLKTVGFYKVPKLIKDYEWRLMSNHNTFPGMQEPGQTYMGTFVLAKYGYVYKIRKENKEQD